MSEVYRENSFSASKETIVLCGDVCVFFVFGKVSLEQGRAFL